MKTSGLFTTHSFRIPIKVNKPVRIVFFGDVHRDSPNHAKRKWQEFLEYARGLKDAYFLGMGDYVDSASTSERQCLANSAFHESTLQQIEDLAEDKVKLLAKELSFMQGRLIGLINGNHYFSFPSGVNTDQKLAGLLRTKYLGVCSFIRIYFDSCGRYASRDIFAHHGMGASRMIGGSLNRVAQMLEGAEADWVVMGHDHKKGAVPGTPRLRLSHSSRSGLKVEQRESWIIRSGSYLASYEDGVTNYNVDACRTPASLGHVELLITPHDTPNRATAPELEVRALV